MNRQVNSKRIAFQLQYPLLSYGIKWILICLIAGCLIGSISAFFLNTLATVTAFRETHHYIIVLLPIGGLLIGLSYYYWGTTVVKGNNLLLEAYENPGATTIPFRMVPLVLFGTLVTHLFGGSAGREGTAVQMGGAIADQFTRFFAIKPGDRKILIIIGISAGFAAVFGTPLAGAVFALEVLVLGKMKLEAVFPCFLAAYSAHYFCLLYPVAHTHYTIPEVPEIDFIPLLWALGCGAVFGVSAFVFSRAMHFWSGLFQSTISYPPLRPFLGGIIIALAVWGLGNTKYIGLGIPVIVEAFSNELPSYDFAIKMLLTTFTLGAGFKGGEVTPLFFIGATLGNALFPFVPLPLALLAGMGFVAVFSGATHTPIACSIMGMELFGMESGIYIALACLAAYACSGNSGIYSSQVLKSPKYKNYFKERIQEKAADLRNL